MKRSLHAVLIILLYLIFVNQSNLFAGKIELKIFSSETGYALTPEFIRISDNKNPESLMNLNSKVNYSYTSVLPQGSYILTVEKQGYRTCQTGFTINSNDIKYDIFLDPLVKNPLLAPGRIKNLLTSGTALIIGFAVDDITGEPLGNVKIKDGKSNVLGSTGINGYFEFSLPASCDTKTPVDLIFEKQPYYPEKYQSFEITPNTDFIFTVRMRKSVTSNSTHYPSVLNDGCEECSPAGLFTDMAVTGFVLPLNIRVGRNCTGTSCTYAQVFSLETYCKYVLPAEIYACWGNLTGGMNSLQACAVAVRSYGMYYVYNPINASLYDICDNTYCQYMGSVTSTNTNNAVDNTFGYILTNSSGVVRSEYSAENNNKGCGNGYSGTGTSWPCINDPVCLNASPNGHGRGLCQWGTVRWATGRLVTTSSPCSQGNAHSYGTKTWQQILSHYYSVSPNNWSVTQGVTGTINTSNSVPSSSNPCAEISISNNISASSTVSLMLGASISPAGTGNWISDPARDVKISFSQGTGNYSRNFKIPCSVQPGMYDMLTALWYDKNNNNTIDGGDFVVSSKLTPNALSISPIGIITISGEIPKEYKLFSNYPNPFNPVTKIKFDIPSVGQRPAFDTKIIIYDLLGREISTLVNQQLKPGSYEVDWDGSGYASGVYFYSLVVNGPSTGSGRGFVVTKRMVLVK